jgi:hypothetical protein
MWWGRWERRGARAAGEACGGSTAFGRGGGVGEAAVPVRCGAVRCGAALPLGARPGAAGRARRRRRQRRTATHGSTAPRSTQDDAPTERLQQLSSAQRGQHAARQAQRGSRRETAADGRHATGPTPPGSRRELGARGVCRAHRPTLACIARHPCSLSYGLPAICLLRGSMPCRAVLPLLAALHGRMGGSRHPSHVPALTQGGAQKHAARCRHVRGREAAGAPCESRAGKAEGVGSSPACLPSAQPAAARRQRQLASRDVSALLPPCGPAAWCCRVTRVRPARAGSSSAVQRLRPQEQLAAARRQRSKRQHALNSLRCGGVFPSCSTRTHLRRTPRARSLRCPARAASAPSRANPRSTRAYPRSRVSAAQRGTARWPDLGGSLHLAPVGVETRRRRGMLALCLVGVRIAAE